MTEPIKRSAEAIAAAEWWGEKVWRHNTPLLCEPISPESIERFKAELARLITAKLGRSAIHWVVLRCRMLGTPSPMLEEAASAANISVRTAFYAIPHDVTMHIQTDQVQILLPGRHIEYLDVSSA